MKVKIALSIFIFVSCFADAQMRSASVHLKNGTILNGFAKRKSETIKFKPDRKAKAIEIKNATVKLLTIEEAYKQSTTYHFFQTHHNSNFIAVQQLISDSNVELYERAERVTNQNLVGDADTFLPAIVPPKYYYVKKNNEEKMTVLGRYNPLFSKQLRINVMKYFADCSTLINKIENKDFRFRDGIEDMVKYYNSNCILQ